MTILNVTIKPSQEQIEKSKLVVRSTRWWNFEARQAGDLVFIKDDYGFYQGLHGKVTPAELDLLNSKGYQTSFGIPSDMKIEDGVYYKTKLPLTEWINALLSFDEWYRYSDSANTYRIHSKLNDIINSRKPTLFEAWFCMQKVCESKLMYIPKELQDEVNGLTDNDFWELYEDKTCRPYETLVQEVSADYAYLTEPCVFED